MGFTIVYMVAGMSSRFGGKIKPLAKVGPRNETLIEYSMEQAINSGFDKIIFVVSKKTEKLFKQEFGDNYRNVPIFYAFQEYDPLKRDKPWGTTDAVCSAKDLIDSNFIVCNGDDIYGREAFQILANHLKKESTCATLGYKLGKVIPEEGKVNRGIFQKNSKDFVNKIKETFDIERPNLPPGLTLKTPCSMNIFALTPQALNHLNNILTKFKEVNKEDKKIECLLPEELESLIRQRKIIMKLYQTDAQWHGLTHPEDKSKVRNELKKYKIN